MAQLTAVPSAALRCPVLAAHAVEPMARAFVESTVGLLWSRLRSHLQRPQMRPAAVQLRGRADATLRDAWEHAVGIAPDFEQSGDRVRMPASLAGEPLAGCSPVAGPAAVAAAATSPRLRALE